MAELVGTPPKKRDDKRDPVPEGQWNLRRGQKKKSPPSGEFYFDQKQVLNDEERKVKYQQQRPNRESKRKTPIADYGGQTWERDRDANKSGPPLKPAHKVNPDVKTDGWQAGYKPKFYEDNERYNKLKEGLEEFTAKAEGRVSSLRQTLLNPKKSLESVKKHYSQGRHLLQGGKITENKDRKREIEGRRKKLVSASAKQISSLRTERTEGPRKLRELLIFLPVLVIF